MYLLASNLSPWLDRAARSPVPMADWVKTAASRMVEQGMFYDARGFEQQTGQAPESEE